MPHDISIKTLQKFLDKVPWSKVLQKAKTTPKGHRVFPSQTPKNDASNNFRLDRGSEVGGPELQSLVGYVFKVCVRDPRAAFDFGLLAFRAARARCDPRHCGGKNSVKLRLLAICVHLRLRLCVCAVPACSEVCESASAFLCEDSFVMSGGSIRTCQTTRRSYESTKRVRAAHEGEVA